MKNLFTEKKLSIFTFLKLILLKFLLKFKRDFYFRFTVIFLAIFFICFLSLNYLFSAPVDFPTNSIFQIEKGKSLRGVSFDLKEAKIIRSRLAFESFFIVFGSEKKIKEGQYTFEKKISVIKVAEIISKGEKLSPAVKITIPEGFTVNEIAELLEKKIPNFNTTEFLFFAKDKEGYLFPDTYFFSKEDNFKEVLKYMQENYQKKIASFRQLFIKAGRTENEVITMASIIEEEASGIDDREIISGILWRRLSMNMPLQVDAIKSTYKSVGLPPKPISNPGLKAIKSALNPVSSPYLYYLHDKNGNIYYARSFEEHKANISKYLKVK